eukprot:TRINITY_DN5155_c0_g1_i5.p1 TRINITY_DN5155_c0_g1~~TRINITY_DN5155_c0_g1_i5.p1  ORF type:complete len:169 (-),score=2.80 TRINITY_DN5155_c0_g1_i5:817-1323(-)
MGFENECQAAHLDVMLARSLEHPLFLRRTHRILSKHKAHETCAEKLAKGNSAAGPLPLQYAFRSRVGSILWHGERNDYKCVWCRGCDFQALGGLMAHLRACHLRFTFKCELNGGRQRMVFMLNPNDVSTARTFGWDATAFKKQSNEEREESHNASGIVSAVTEKKLVM